MPGYVQAPSRVRKTEVRRELGQTPPVYHQPGFFFFRKISLILLKLSSIYPICYLCMVSDQSANQRTNSGRYVEK